MAYIAGCWYESMHRTRSSRAFPRVSRGRQRVDLDSTQVATNVQIYRHEWYGIFLTSPSFPKR